MAVSLWNSPHPSARLCALYLAALETLRRRGTFDLDFQNNLSFGERNEVAWGFDFRHGIATQLLDLAEIASRGHNAQFLHLEVSKGNPAIELYRRRGFLDHQRYLMTKRI